MIRIYVFFVTNLILIKRTKEKRKMSMQLSDDDLIDDNSQMKMTMSSRGDPGSIEDMHVSAS